MANSPEIDFALVLSRTIDSIKNDPSQLRNTVYELARTKLLMLAWEQNSRITVLGLRDAWKETLKRVGGSQSDDWNHVLGNQAIQSLWIKQSDMEVRQRQSFGLEVPTGEESGS